MNKKYLITLFILCISLSSCLKIYFRIYGIKKCKAVSIQNLSNFLTKNLISDSLILQVDSVKYKKLINTKNIDTLKVDIQTYKNILNKTTNISESFKNSKIRQLDIFIETVDKYKQDNDESYQTHQSVIEMLKRQIK